jgi:hypothetical protein
VSEGLVYISGGIFLCGWKGVAANGTGKGVAAILNIYDAIVLVIYVANFALVIAIVNVIVFFILVFFIVIIIIVIF